MGNRLSNHLNNNGFFSRWFTGMADALLLGLLWLLCCLPLVTILPACIALYDAVARCIHGSEGGPYKHFFRVFKAELLRGIGYTLLVTLLTLVLVYGYNLLNVMGQENQMFSIYAAVYLGTMLIPMGILAWMIPLEARFEHSFFGLFKSAAVFTIVHLPTTAILLGLLAAAVVIALFIPGLILILPGILVTLQSWFAEKVLKRYIPEETSDDTAE